MPLFHMAYLQIKLSETTKCGESTTQCLLSIEHTHLCYAITLTEEATWK